jgi:hypothetical protein
MLLRVTGALLIFAPSEIFDKAVFMTNCRDNDVGDDSIVDGLSAITKTMRIRACLIGRQIRIPFDHGVPAMQENSLDRENPEAVMNENFW